MQARQLELFLEYAPAAMAMFDREMRYILASRRWMLDYGVEPPVTGRSHYEIFPDLPQRWKEAHQRGLAGETIRAEEDKFERSDGRIQWLRWQLLPWRESDGTVGGIVIFSEDITEQKEITRRYDEAQRRLKAVMEAAPVGISYSDDATCQHITGNKALWQQFEAGPEENISASSPDPSAVGRQLSFFMGERKLHDYELPLQRAVSERREIPPMELEIILPSGRHWHALASGAPVLGENGEIIGGVAVTVDITERLHMMEALVEADRRKDEFLAVLAHELRNPLAPLRNSLYVLRRSHMASGAAKLLEMMERQVDNLVRLVDDLMEVSRITRGKIELRKEALSLQDLIHQAAATSAPAVEAKNHALQLSLGDEDLIIDGDPLRLTQIFGNLINNAAKFTPTGGRIEIMAKRAGDEAVVCVRDNGRGISEHMLGRIFEFFTQECIPGEPRDGIGVGLALSRSLVELHGGRLDAFSEGEGRGSELVVHLPLADAQRLIAPGAKESSSQDMPAKKVLIVDDNRAAADSLKLLLEALGEDSRVAYCGKEGLEAVVAFKPEIVFLDLGMAEMDGYETARRIRQLPGGRTIRLFALSGWGREEDRSRSSEVGFDGHLVKPINMDALVECLVTLDHGS